MGRRKRHPSTLLGMTGVSGGCRVAGFGFAHQRKARKSKPRRPGARCKGDAWGTQEAEKRRGIPRCVAGRPRKTGRRKKHPATPLGMTGVRGGCRAAGFGFARQLLRSASFTTGFGFAHQREKPGKVNPGAQVPGVRATPGAPRKRKSAEGFLAAWPDVPENGTEVRAGAGPEGPIPTLRSNDRLARGVT